MGLINRAIPTLIGGVSQQPASLRHPSQVTAMENCIPSPASGVRKRAGTQAIKKLSSSPLTGAFVQWINRGTAGTSERYYFTVNAGVLKVYDWSGNEQTVTFPDGMAYLASSAPWSDFSAVTVADFTFLVNKTKKVAMVAATPFTPTQTLYIMVKVGLADCDYTATLDGTAYTYTLTPNPNTTVKTSAVATAWAAVIDAAANFAATASGSLITITKVAGGTTFTFDISDGYGNTAAFSFQDRVSLFSDLPRRFVENVVISVKGDPNGAAPSWFVKWKKTSTNSDGVWEETVAPGYAITLDPTTMPFKLVRNADATWTLSKVTWTNRLVGDDLSNPVPSFVGRTINDVFFHRNRLSFLADENCIMSQAGKFYNFFGTTARAVIDSDPIDMSASTTKVTLLRSALPFGRTLLITSDRQQFIMPAQDVLSPRTARLDGATAFECSTDVKPVALGKDAFFVEPRGSFSGVREMFINTQTITNDADDVTSHVSSYIPSGVFKLATCPARDMLFALTSAKPASIFVFNSFWRGEARVQAAWHEWLFTAGSTVVSAEVYGTTLALIIDRADGAWMETLELEEVPTSPVVWQVCLDRYYSTTSGSYDATSDTTTWALPYTETSTMQLIIVDKAKEIGQVLDCTRPSSAYVSVAGNYAGTTVIIGARFTQRIRLSELFYRDQKDQSVIDGRLQLRNLTVALQGTGFFSSKVMPLGRPANTYAFPSKPLGLAALVIGTRVMSNGHFTFPIMAKSDEVDIDLLNDTALPAKFQSAEWDGVFSMKARRL